MQIATRVQEGSGESFLKTGIAEFRVIAINPTRDALTKLLGSTPKEDAKEIEYIGEKDGKNKAKVAFWVEDAVSGWKGKLEFDLTDEDASTKNGNPVWVNQVGEVAKVAKENLQSWFQEFYKSKDDKTVIGEKNFRKSKLGEAALVEFLRVWMNRKTSTNVKVDWWNPDCNILPDMKKIFRGNFSEIIDMWKAPEEDNITGTVVLAVYVDSYDDKDGNLKHAQKIWTYKAAPGYMMKKYNVAMSTNSWDASKDTKKFKDELTGEYGIKKGFKLQPLGEFNTDEHIEATNQTLKMGEDNTPLDTDY